MKAIIPAAGIGTRLRPHTYTLPKALLYVAGKPIISHILDDVVPLKPSTIVLIVGYKGELIEEFVRRHYPDLPVEFVVQEERRGIGHAVDLTRAAADTGEPLLIVLGDTIIKTDLKQVVAQKTSVLGVREVEDPRRFGVCEVRDGRIVRLVEKPEVPPSKLALVGLYYVLDGAALFRAVREIIERNITTNNEYQITDALQRMIESGTEFRPFEIDEWFDCGKPEAMLETNRKLLKNAPGARPIEGSIIIPPVSISPGAEIVNSIIGPYVSIAERVVIHSSIVRDSVLSEGASVTDAMLESSLVGANAVIRGGFKKFDVGDSSEISFK
ncbi:MAG TPA: sugar phosphate nucleotidyltransferase [Candidatus Krumholzibacteria bacterium]|nr:sugar phosphate nucleotidyltransferase [Candidatus Krumholzibacteria bacterium]